MALWFRRTLIAAAFILCCSCEKHPLGQMPDVQREQPDPAKKVWSHETEKNPDEPSASHSPAEVVPHEAR
jgi:hypothetical protein